MKFLSVRAIEEVCSDINFDALKCFRHRPVRFAKHLRIRTKDHIPMWPSSCSMIFASANFNRSPLGAITFSTQIFVPWGGLGLPHFYICSTKLFLSRDYGSPLSAFLSQVVISSPPFICTQSTGRVQKFLGLQLQLSVFS